MIARGGVLLLETRLVFLVDNDKAEVAEGQEDGAAGTKDDIIGMVGELLTPYLHALGIAILAVVDAEATAKDILKALHNLNGEGYLGKEIKHLLMLGDGLGDEMDVEFGLARRRHSVQEDYIMVVKLTDYSVEGCALGCTEGFYALGVVGTAIVKPPHLFLVCIKDSLVDEAFYGGGGGIGLVHELLLRHASVAVDGGKLEEGVEGLELLYGTAKHASGYLTALIGAELLSEANEELRAGMPALLGLETGRKGRLVDITDRRKVVLGQPLPKTQLLVGYQRSHIEDIDDIFNFKIRLCAGDIGNYADVLLRLAERTEHTHANGDTLREGVGNAVGEVTVQRQRQYNLCITHLSSFVCSPSATVSWL